MYLFCTIYNYEFCFPIHHQTVLVCTVQHLMLNVSLNHFVETLSGTDGFPVFWHFRTSTGSQLADLQTAEDVLANYLHKYSLPVHGSNLCVAY